MSDEKRDQVERYLKGAARERERRENEKRRAGRGGRRERRRRRRAAAEWTDEDEDFEPLRRRAGGARSGRAPRAAPDADRLVVGVDAGRAIVEEADGTEVAARLAHELAARGNVVVGDRVALERPPSGPPRVVAVGPRRSALTRTDPARPEEVRVIAANLDRAVIVLAPSEGVVREGIADRIRVALARQGVDDLLVVNKTDLPSAEERAALDRRIAWHAASGRAALAVSAHTGEGVEALRAELVGRTVAFVGPSGVGKSTLLNALDGAERATGAVRAGDGKGRHTTTSSRLVRLACGAAWIDTPGVRTFGLGPVALDELRAAFPELAVVATDCRFADCRHLGEDGCAVAEAAARDGHVDERLAAWRRILASDEEG